MKESSKKRGWLFSVLGLAMAFVLVGCGSDSLFDNNVNDNNGNGGGAGLAVTVVPGNGATDVPMNTMITAAFDKEVNASTLTSGTLYLMDANGTRLTGTLHTTTNADGNSVVTFILEPGTTMAGNSQYSFVVTQAVTALDGGKLGADSITTFTTGSSTALQVYIEPGDGQDGIPINTSIVAYFNEEINASTLAGGMSLENNASTAVAGTIQYDAANNAAVFTPDADLNADTAYTFTVTPDVKALNGDTLESDRTITFTTGNFSRVIDAAVFTMNSNVLAVDTNESDLLGPITGNLLGTQLQVDAVGEQGLAQADVSLAGLIQSLRTVTGSTTVGALVGQTIDLTALLQIISAQMDPTTEAAAKDVIDRLIAAVDANGTDQAVPIGDLLQFSSGLQSMTIDQVLALEGVSGVKTNTVSLLSAVNSLLEPTANSVIEVPLAVSGLTDGNSTLRAQLLSPAGFAILAAGDGAVRSSQTRIQLRLGVLGTAASGLFDLLNTILSTLTLGLVDIGSPAVNVSLYVVLAESTGSLDELSVADIQMAVQNGLATVYLGTIPDDVFFSRQSIDASSFDPLTLVDVEVAGVTLARIDVKAYAQGDSNSTTLHFLPTNTQQTQSAFAPLGDTLDSLVATLVGNLELEVTLVGLTVGTGDANLGQILGGVTTLLSSVVTGISPLLNTLSDTLGLYTGRTDVTMLGLFDHYDEH